MNRKRSATETDTTSIIEARLTTSSTATIQRSSTGTRPRRKRPVTAATHMITAKAMSGGAGSKRTTPISSSAIAIAVS